MQDLDRLKRLVHYVCSVCPDEKQLGAIKLNKIFWYADTTKYRETGQTISGATYIKRQFGPVVKDMPRAIQGLEQEGKIRVHEKKSFGNIRREYEVLSDADVASIPEEDLASIKQLTHLICQAFTASEISDLSHDIVWEAADLGEEIPLYAALASGGSVPLTEDNFAWADKVLDKLYSEA